MPLPPSRLTFCAVVAFLLSYALASATSPYKQFTPGHYVFSGAPNFTDQPIATYLAATATNGSKVFRGVQRTYYWRDMEPTFHAYDFSKIDAELAQIPSGQKLIIQFSFKSWTAGGGDWAFPTYIHDNPAGIYGDPYGSPAGSGVGYYVNPASGNHYPFIWNQYVQNRMKEMLQALGDRYDSNVQVECINMCESATGGATPTLVTDDVYGDAIVTLFVAMRNAFPTTQVIQYANFPKSQQVKYAYNCLANNVGWGGPDVVQDDVVNNPGAAPSLVGTDTSPGTYAFYWDAWNYSGVHSATFNGSTYDLTIGNHVVKGSAVQNMDYTWSQGFANNYLNATQALHLNYMFWQAQWTTGTDHNPDIIAFVKGKVDANGAAGGLNETLEVTTTFVSEGTYDGWVLESGENTNVGGSLNSTSTATNALMIGDDASKKQYKSILSFDTSSLPDGATILSATLKLKRGTISNNPSGLGAIRVDVQTYGINSNIALENGDFQAATTVSQAATLSYPSSNGTWSTGALNAAGRGAVNKVGRTQFRVYFAVDDDNDAQADYLGFYSGDATATADRPTLEITYQ